MKTFFGVKAGILATIGIGVATPLIMGVISVAENSILKRKLKEKNDTNESLSLELSNLNKDMDIWKDFGNRTAIINQGLTAQIEVLSRDLDSEILKNNQLELKRQKCAEKGIYYSIRGYRGVLDTDTFNSYCK